jgi:hypothetical protein
MMISMLAHVTGMDSVALVAMFGLGWVLGGLATAGFFRKASRTNAR